MNALIGPRRFALVSVVFGLAMAVPRAHASPNMVDPTFDAGIGLNTDYPAGEGLALAIAADGNILVGGVFSGVAGQPRTNLARLHPDGKVDEDFVAGPLTMWGVSLVVPGLAGECLVAGPSTLHPWWALERVDASGIPNAEFRANYGRLGFTYDQPIRQVAVQADGRILVAGPFVVTDADTGIVRRGVVRLYPNGKLDASWDLGNVTGAAGVMDIGQTADGLVVVVGDFTAIAGQPRKYIARLSASGGFDASFVTANLDETFKLSHVGIRDLRLHSDGTMIIVPEAQVGAGNVTYLARLRADGNVDTAFQATYLEDQAHALALQRDGKVLTSENRSSEGFLMGWFRRRTNAGIWDPVFPPNYAPWSFNNGIVRAMAVQADGGIVIAGRFTLQDARGSSRHGIARLNPLYLVEPDRPVGQPSTLHLVGEPNRHYEVLGSSDLKAWTVITNFVSTNDVTVIRDAINGPGHRSYNARQLE
ncbi:MAG: delta-60 repeat domain-containing protein [Verrucomicrobiales bacterium]|nr:delta-60 repeat domain-containing protein [Verrucomicrobiales bacterium]